MSLDTTTVTNYNNLKPVQFTNIKFILLIGLTRSHSPKSHNC